MASSSPPLFFSPVNSIGHSSNPCSSSLQPLSKPTINLKESDLQWLHSTKTRRFDVIVIGAGPTGLRVADLASSSSNGLKVCLVDPSPLSPLTNIYGVWVDEFLNLGLPQSLLLHTWPTSSIHIDHSTSFLLPRPYSLLSNHSLKTTLLSHCISNGVVFHKGRALRLLHHLPTHSSLKCDTGCEDLTADLVIDATGFNTTLTKYPRPKNHAFQSAYGVLARVESHPFDLNKMVIMDWRYPNGNTKHPTFLYAMPMSRELIFLEETSLVGRPAMGREELKKRMERRMESMGIKVREVVNEEECLIKMGGPLPLMNQEVVGVGGAGGGVHPSTGYMVVEGMKMAAVVGEECVAGFRGGELRRRVWDKLWPARKRYEREFYRMGMEGLLGMDLRQCRGFFEAFFGMDRRLWEGFLSRRLGFEELVGMSVAFFSRASFSTKLDLVTLCALPVAAMVGNIVGDMCFGIR